MRNLCRQPSNKYETVNDWESLATTIDDYFKLYNSYIFRGQADAEWLLSSTLTRALRDNYPNARNKKQLEKFHLYLFRENIRGRSNLDLEHTSENELWALGQHYGLHTPLLDWARSPYVALYFSLLGECNSSYRALWAIHYGDVVSINKDINNKSQRVEIIDPMTNHNARLVSQRGLFLKIPLGKDLESWVKKSSKEFEWITMYKISFPDIIRNDALAALDNMNINSLSLFPDLFGSALHTNYQFEIEPYLDVERGNQWKRVEGAAKLGEALLVELKKIKENKDKP